MRAGDYVRTKQKGFQPPQIAKIKSMKRDAGYNNQYYIELDHNLLPDYNLFIYEEDIAKSSPDITDLVEENDYINGLRVEKNKYGELYTSYVYYGGDIGKQCEVYTTWLKEYTEDMIYEIVTKESFENISYKVGE